MQLRGVLQDSRSAYGTLRGKIRHMTNGSLAANHAHKKARLRGPFSLQIDQTEAGGLILISTRRFCERPLSVELSAIGCDLP